MIPAPHQAPISLCPPLGSSTLRSHHTPAGHVHYFLREGLPVSCCLEPHGISRVRARPAEIHPASFIYHNLRFEALRVGGTMIIVRDNRDVLEEIYLDKHIYLLADGVYSKVALTSSLRDLMHNDYAQGSYRILNHLF